MRLPVIVQELWPIFVGVLTVVVAVGASGHAIVYKRDSRAAVAWVGLIWLAPIIGAVLYALLGINRVRRRAALQRAIRDEITGTFERPVLPAPVAPLPPPMAHLRQLAALVERVAGRALTAGNTVAPLQNGDEAYPDMLGAIEAARASLALSTYIFDNDAVGRRFAQALAAAVRRGVAVRVLVDAVGARYSWPPMVRALRRLGVPAARYGPTVLPWRLPYFNLRLHRKLLIADGRVGFTGGMNIREGHELGRRPRYPVQDLHFRLEGPVVAHLMQAFADDWAYTRREGLTGAAWFPRLEPTGPVLARGLTDGPDEDFEKARFTLLGALACAQRSVRIVTPYFIPDAGLITALDVAALRGVQVDILIPEVGNLPTVQWASTAQLWQVLSRGCRVFRTKPPFDHTKIMLVDDAWALVGSSNWDARSLRLNFEFDVECYDAELAARLETLVRRKLADARPVTFADVNGRSLPIKLRDGLARLAAPYL